MADINLRGRITLQDDASRPIQSIKQQLAALLSTQGAVGAVMGTLVGGGVAALAGSALELAQKVGQATWELGEMGARAQRTETSFERLAAGVGASGQAMLQAMATASQGTVANADLMMAANRALVLGVADSTAEMAALTEAAIIRGRDVGVSATQAVNDLVTGIGRMSPEILDNLGIANASGAFKEYAAELGKTVDQLSEIEKKQALVNAVLASTEGVDLVGDAASSFERMDAALANAQEALGKLFSPAIAAIAQSLADAATGVTEAITPGSISDTTSKLAEYQAQLDGILRQLDALERNKEVLATQPAFAPPELQSATPGDIDGLRQQAEATARLIYQTQLQLAALQGISEQTARTKDEQYAYNQSLWDGQAAWSAFQTQAQIAAAAVMDARQQIMASAQGQIESIAREIAAVQGTDAGLDWLEMGNRLLDDQISKWAEAGYTIQEIGAVLLPNWLANLGKVANGANKAQTAVAGVGKGAREASGSLARESARMMRNLASVGAAGRKAAIEISRIGAAMAAIDTGRGGGLGEGFRTADYEPVLKTTDALGALDLAMSDLMDTAYTGGGGGGIAGIGDQFDDLRSKVESVMSDATTLDFGLDPTNFLPREDAINENARRLGAIMRDGIAGQEWLDEFKAEVPALWEELSASGDPKGAAARMLQEFQQGLRPELLDREMIKARVKAMILGEENTSALAQEIAAELSGELGMSLAQAQQAVAGVMGVGAGGMAGTGAQVGPDGAVQGTQFVAAWAGMVKTQLTEFENTGKQAGSSWGAGFMATVEGGVPGQLVALLVSLVTPGVLANIAAQGSRTGAQ